MKPAVLGGNKSPIKKSTRLKLRLANLGKK